MNGHSPRSGDPAIGCQSSHWKTALPTLFAGGLKVPRALAAYLAQLSPQALHTDPGFQLQQSVALATLVRDITSRS